MRSELNCREVERIILDLGQDSIHSEGNSAFQTHLRICASCQSLSLAAAKTRKSLASIPPAASRSSMVERAIAATNGLDRPAPHNRSWFTRATRTTAMAAAVSVVVITVVLLVNRIGVPHKPTQITDSGAHVYKALLRTKSDKRDRRTIPHNRLANAVATEAETLRRAPSPNPAVDVSPRQPLMDDLAYMNGADPAHFADWMLSGKKPPRADSPVPSPTRRPDDFVSVPLPQLASTSRTAMTEAMRAYQKEREIIDDRLAARITLSIKGASFEDICGKLSAISHVDLSAGRTVSDDKATIFCREKPLRDLMRQINSLFGFRWQRMGGPGAYRYELFQDLKSQLAEEEMRNRDRNEALIDLDRKMQSLQKYLGLTPDDAHAKAYNPEIQASATQEDLNNLNTLGGAGWAAAHLYFNLSGDQLSALREGRSIQFSSAPSEGQSALPSSVAAGVLQSLRNGRVHKLIDGSHGVTVSAQPPGSDPAAGQPLSAFPNVETIADMRLDFNDLGQVTLWGGAGASVEGDPTVLNSMPMAVGVSPSVGEPDNAAANAAFAHDPSLSLPVTIVPRTSAWRGREFASSFGEDAKPTAAGVAARKRLTTSDVLEAIHRSTGMDLVADSYTRLYAPDKLSVNGKSLFAGLNQLSDSMRLRWSKDEGWLRFRSTSFFADRLKEVPNRLIDRWLASRREHSGLTPTDLMEISQLRDNQLNAGSNASFIPECYGLREWYLGSVVYLRPHWRFLAALTPPQRRQALDDQGLDVGKLSVAQQQRYFALGLAADVEKLRITIARAGKPVGVVTRDYNNEANWFDAPPESTVMQPIDITYRFTDSGATVGEWRLRLHLYVRPRNP